jgi:hypothetical protein
MRQRTGRKKNRVVPSLALVGAAGLAFVLAGWTSGGTRVATLTPSETIALRFPDAGYDDWDSTAIEATGAISANLNVDDDSDDLATLFNPAPMLRNPGSAMTVATVSVTPGQAAPTTAKEVPVAAAPATDTPAKAAMKLASVQSKPVVVPPAPKARPGAVLTEAQIRNIKTRLRLTRDQQDMWPAVEQALRDLSYDKSSTYSDRRVASSQLGTIDPYSSEVQRLKSAAFPLIMSFTDEQKHELRIIAHVAGLEKLAAQF